MLKPWRGRRNIGWGLEFRFLSMRPKKPRPLLSEIPHSAPALFFILSLNSILFAMPPLSLLATDTAKGWYRETMLPADIDGDGDKDFFSGEGRGGPVWWFEKTGDGWLRHKASDSNLTDVGTTLIDADGDGRIDKASSSYWYRNPGFDSTGKDRRFTLCRYSEQQYIHDIYTQDMDRDGRDDIVSIDFDGITWFRSPRPDSACGPWEKVQVNGKTEDPPQHGGIAVGDLDGDGDPDISRIDRWFENTDGQGRTWTEHLNIKFGNWDPSAWGLSGRALITDINGDGRKDILQTECDLPNGRVAWIENGDGKGGNWITHLIKDSTEKQDFHSLIYADFDGDGDKDVFSAGSAHSTGAKKAYIWENLDSKGGSWKEHVVLTGDYAIHDAAAADMDDDGDIDVLAKIFGEGGHFLLINQKVPNALGQEPQRRNRNAAHRASAKGWPQFQILPGAFSPAKKGKAFTLDGRCHARPK